MSQSVSAPSPAPAATTPPGSRLSLTFALREMRGGLSGFFVFIACIALGVMAIAGVNSFAASLANGLAREGRVILGGDAAFSLIQREATEAERATLAAEGQMSVAATLRAVSRTSDGRTALVEVKAVDGAYPLYGAAGTEPAIPLPDLFGQRDGAYGAAVDAALLARLDLKTGARLTVGGATIELRAVLASEPDKYAGGIGFGPRMLMSEAALRATGLVQPGSLIRWYYRLKLPGAVVSDAAVEAMIARANAAQPDAGWEVRSRANASPQLERNVERFTQYLTMVGLTALLVGGVGVANAVRAHLDRRRDVIATFKSLGASGSRVFAIYFAQVMMLAVVGSIPGLILGAALPYLIAYAFGAIIPLPISPSISAPDLALSFLYGLLTAAAFALWPLGRAHDIPASALFRGTLGGERHFPRRGYIVATVIVVAALAGLAILLSYDRRIAAVFVAAAALVFVGLRLVAMLVMWLAAKAPHPRATGLRLALANIHRPGALTPSVVLSLGLGLSLLVTVIQVDGNLQKQFMDSLPDKAPAFYFLDIRNTETERFDAFVRDQAPQANLDRVPMLRGRIVAVNDIRAEDLKPAAQAAWVLQSDRGITYGDDIPQGSRIVAGDWWPKDYAGEPLISMEQRIAEGLGVGIGDRLTVNALGRNVTARIANLRTVDWQSLGINFVLVFSPNTFRGAPHTHIATLTYPGGTSGDREMALLRQLADAFPNITTVRVRDAIEAVGELVTNLILGIRGASGITLVAAMLVLGGALAAGHRQRVYDAVILKTLGATRTRLIGAYALEYALLGLATAVFGILAGSAAAAVIVTQIMNLEFAWLPGSAALVALGAIVVTVVLGLLGTWSALGHKPASVLRNL